MVPQGRQADEVVEPLVEPGGDVVVAGARANTTKVMRAAEVRGVRVEPRRRGGSDHRRGNARRGVRVTGVGFEVVVDEVGDVGGGCPVAVALVDDDGDDQRQWRQGRVPSVMR